MAYKIPAVSVILNQFPEFTREDYPVFIKFVELYYKHINESKIEGIGQSFESVRDLDENLDKFVDEMWKEFGINVPRTTDSNDRYFLKHIKEFYSTKGSEESFRILFRHLYNTEIDFKYPKEQILIASDGKWVQDISVVVNVSSGNIFNIVDQLITVFTNQQTINVTANRVRLIEDGHYEVFLDKFQRDLISVGSILSLNDISATVVESISKISVYRQGSGFYVGQLFTLPSATGTNARIKVTKVGPNGELINVQLLDFGSGYTSDFNASILSGSIPTITVVGELNSQTLGFVDSGFISTNFYSDLDYTSGSYSGETIREFYTQIDVAQGTTLDDEKMAVLYVKVGAIRRYPGFYSDSSGFLSDAYFLQDGNYYQNFSYVISCIESLNTYKNIVKSLVHPAGMKLFGNQVFSNEFDVVSVLQLINRYFQQSITDSVNIADNNKYTLIKTVSDLVTNSDYNFRYFNKGLTDSLSIIDIINTILSKSYQDNISVSDETNMSPGKSIIDSVSFLSIDYWDTTYADITYIDTNIEPIISKLGSTYSIALTN